MEKAMDCLMYQTKVLLYQSYLTNVALWLLSELLQNAHSHSEQSEDNS